MTVTELHYDFKFKFDKIAGLPKPDLNVAEIDWLLNEAQTVLVKQRYGKTNSTRSGFESTQKRIDDLKTIVIKYPLQPELVPVRLEDGIYELDLSRLTYPYLFLLTARAKVINNSNGCITWANLIPIQHDDFNDVLRDPFNNSNKDELLYNFGRSSSGTSSSIYMYPNGLEVLLVRLNYLKTPSKISLGGYTYLDGNTYPQSTSELPEQIHPELVDLACELAAGILENPDYLQLKAQKLTIHE